MKPKNIGWLLILAAIIWMIIETWYFGWNLKPLSKEERVCDCIYSFLFIYGILLVFDPFKLIKKQYGTN